MAQTWTADLVFRKLRGLFPSPAHTLLGQVRNGTGFSRRTARTADGLAISTWPSRGLWIAGIEIKVYRSDWKKELADAEKSGDMMKWCNYWYVAAPAGLVENGELPQTWGLIEVDGRGAKIHTTAPKLTPEPIDMLLLCSVLRNFSESYVSKDEVREEAEKLAKAHAEEAERQLALLRESVSEFEKASGVKIDNKWNAPQIGEAVKVVLGSHLLYGFDGIGRLRKDAEYIVEACKKIESAKGGQS
jgi:hypothetical protein